MTPTDYDAAIDYDYAIDYDGITTPPTPTPGTGGGGGPGRYISAYIPRHPQPLTPAEMEKLRLLKLLLEDDELMVMMLL